MQAYNPGFARLYNLRWGSFAQQFAPRIRELYESTSAGQVNRSLLDLCCGTGQLAVHFLEASYRVVGLDASEDMLTYARENAGQYLSTGQAPVLHDDPRSGNDVIDIHGFYRKVKPFGEVFRIKDTFVIVGSLF